MSNKRYRQRSRQRRETDNTSDKDSHPHAAQLGVARPDLDLVITTAIGTPVRPSAMSTRFRTTATDAGFAGLRFHDLRHSHASIMLRQGQAPHVVSQRLGHASVAFTLAAYASVLPGQQRSAAESLAAAILG